MIVSWNWLKEYVQLDMPPEEVERRLMMAGLNHEGTEAYAGDLAIDLEVTSNRPDCLGHIGVAREIAVLWEQDLKIPDPQPKATSGKASDLIKVSIECPELCPRYTARVIRGVKLGPSPDWMQARLKTAFLKQKKDGTLETYTPINNVVDITNYVLLECGQPLHAFDYAHLRGQQIIVRRATKDEQFTAIDHKTYALHEQMCVIADGERAVALGGVMGGAESEVSDDTVDILIEAADFSPLAIRNAVRKLNLPSPSSYRFERGVDPEGIDWASRRCAELVLELAGGELAEGMVDAGSGSPEREPVVLRLSQLPRVLGIEVPADEVRKILIALGNQETKADANSVTVIPPSWRRDLTREIDLVEEVARIHGYEAIPEDVGVRMAPSKRDDEDRVLERAREALMAAGYDEALTLSMISDQWSEAFQPWTKSTPLKTQTSILRGADHLRCTLIPSLLASRAVNESLANPVIELFEVAGVYLPQGNGLPREEKMIGLTSGGDFSHVKGLVESLVQRVAPDAQLEVEAATYSQLNPSRTCKLKLVPGDASGNRAASGGNGEADHTLGYIGELTPQAAKLFKLRGPSTVAELRLAALQLAAVLIPQHQPLSNFPSTSRDVNLIVDESVRWSQIETAARTAGGDALEQVAYQETYRDEKRDGANKKRLLFSLTLRADHTLTSEEADGVRDQIIQACVDAHGAVLVG